MNETDREFVERFFSEAQERGWLVGEDKHRLRDIARRAAKLEAALTGIEWPSTNEDDTEWYRVYISRHQMDEIKDALAKAREDKT